MSTQPLSLSVNIYPDLVANQDDDASKNRVTGWLKDKYGICFRAEDSGFATVFNPTLYVKKKGILGF